MNYDEFVAAVQERGEYPTRAEAEDAARSVLEVLASRITPGEAEDMAAQLPGSLADAARPHEAGGAESFGVEEFCRRVADATGTSPTIAEWDASAVLSTVADAVSGGELNQILSQLPSGYAVLFGKPELT